MNGENGDGERVVEPKDDGDLENTEDTIVITEDAADVDDVGDISAQINVEKLVAKVESGDLDAAEHEKEVRKRLEEIEEQKRADEELDSTYNFNLDDDL